MRITDKMIEELSGCAKLEFSASEKKQVRKDMITMLTYIEKMNRLDTEGVEPMTHVFPIHNVFREDVVTDKDNRQAMFKDSAAGKNGFFQVPQTIE